MTLHPLFQNIVRAHGFDSGRDAYASEEAPQARPLSRRASRYLSGQAETLKAINDSLTAPRFRALENYGATPEPTPSPEEVLANCKKAHQWHVERMCIVAAELQERRERNSNPVLIDEAVRTLAFHRDELERIEGEMEVISSTQVAAE